MFATYSLSYKNRGSNFDSDLFKEFRNTQNMNISGTPKYRWPNRKKINRMIQNMLSTFVQSDQRDWCTNLPSLGKYVTLLHGDFYLSKDSGEEDFFDKILDLNTFENIELGFNFNDDDRDKGKEDQNDEGDQAPEVDAAPLMELLPRGLVIVVLTQRPWPLQMFLLHSNASLLNSRMYGPSWLSRYALVASHSVRVLKDSELSHNATPLNPASADWRRVLFKSA
ncbi:hypothetical protein MAR_004825 [Mya arenaria]|uniref:Uncharacterized protein n=1 Tax=Mya arenaria TaxID=6604 RepID=A0ABY7EXP6_MYAAR|nr:hypothetical protein MAR_004825 [Mya arenaria]